jgi:uncharacterized protein
MQTYLRNKPAWQQLIIFVGLTVGILLIAFTLGLSIVARLNHLSVMQIASMGPQDYARPELIGVIRGLLIVQFFGIFFLPSLVFAYLADPHPLAYAGMREPRKYSFLLLAAITMGLAYFTVEFLGTMNESIVRFLPRSMQKWIESGESEANGTLENILSMKSPADLLRTIFLVGALPAIGEELFFRGILQRIFIQIFKSAWPGIVFTAFLFSAFHMQFMGFIPRMALGTILGALYWFSGSIFTSMLGHFIFNTINILLIYYKFAELDSKTTSTTGYVLFGLASIAGVIFLLNLIRKKSTTTYDGEFPPIAENPLSDDGERPL